MSLGYLYHEEYRSIDILTCYMYTNWVECVTSLAPKLFSNLIYCVQNSIAMETLQVFAPLAKLLGMYQIKVWYIYIVAKAKD